MKYIRHLPNVLTLINLLLGMLAIIALMNAIIETALILMAGALIADILDGALARRLGVTGGLGTQLDSLADMVSFGVLPSLMLFYCGARYGGVFPGQQIVAVFASLAAVSAGLRLGRFNVDTRPREFFWGLPTPAGAIMVAGWLWAQHTGQDMRLGVADLPWLGVAVPLFLMVLYQVPLKLPGLKSPASGLYTVMALFLLTIIAFGILGPIAIPLAILSLVSLGMINTWVSWY